MGLSDTQAVFTAQERRLAFRLRIMRMLAKSGDNRATELEKRHADFALRHSMTTLAMLRKARFDRFSI